MEEDDPKKAIECLPSGRFLSPSLMISISFFHHEQILKMGASGLLDS